MSEEISKLPDRIKVRILQGKSGVFIAELLDYGISTEADSLEEIDYLINDLIFTFFDVPKELQKQIRYVKASLEDKIAIDLKKYLMFRKYITPDAYRCIN